MQKTTKNTKYANFEFFLPVIFLIGKKSINIVLMFVHTVLQNVQNFPLRFGSWEAPLDWKCHKKKTGAGKIYAQVDLAMYQRRKYHLLCQSKPLNYAQYIPGQKWKPGKD